MYRDECGVEYDTTCHQELSDTFTIKGYEPQKMKRDLKETLVPPSVPRTLCQPAPTIQCSPVLSPVTEVACEPVVTQDCRKIAVEVRSTTQI